jgi:putative zinc finger protein
MAATTRLQLSDYLTPVFTLVEGVRARMLALEMMGLMGRRLMHEAVSCKRATRELSNYIDDRLNPELRKQIEEHLRVCSRCAVVLDSLRKLLYVAGDENMFAIPFEYTVDWDRIMCAQARKR